jgi:hypothetical protein
MTTKRVHMAFTEPHPEHGTWTCPEMCFESVEAASEYRAALDRVAGRAAADRRAWASWPCDGVGCGNRATL